MSAQVVFVCEEVQICLCIYVRMYVYVIYDTHTRSRTHTHIYTKITMTTTRWWKDPVCFRCGIEALRYHIVNRGGNALSWNFSKVHRLGRLLCFYIVTSDTPAPNENPPQTQFFSRSPVSRSFTLSNQQPAIPVFDYLSLRIKTVARGGQSRVNTGDTVSGIC